VTPRYRELLLVARTACSGRGLTSRGMTGMLTAGGCATTSPHGTAGFASSVLSGTPLRFARRSGARHEITGPLLPVVITAQQSHAFVRTHLLRHRLVYSSDIMTGSGTNMQAPASVVE